MYNIEILINTTLNNIKELFPVDKKIKLEIHHGMFFYRTGSTGGANNTKNIIYADTYGIHRMNYTEKETMHMIAHEYGHLYFNHPICNKLPVKHARALEAQADKFATLCLRKLGVIFTEEEAQAHADNLLYRCHGNVKKYMYFPQPGTYHPTPFHRKQYMLNTYNSIKEIEINVNKFVTI